MNVEERRVYRERLAEVSWSGPTQTDEVLVRSGRKLLDLLDEIDRLEAAVKRVRELHVSVPYDNPHDCLQGCNISTNMRDETWPCPTIQALDDQPSEAT